MVAACLPYGAVCCEEVNGETWTPLYEHATVGSFLETLRQHGGRFNCLGIVPDNLNDRSIPSFDEKFAAYRGTGMVYDVRLFLDPVCAVVYGRICAVINMPQLGMHINELDSAQRFQRLLDKLETQEEQRQADADFEDSSDEEEEEEEEESTGDTID